MPRIVKQAYSWLVCVIDIANSISTGSSNAWWLLELPTVLGNHFIDRLFRERKVHKNAPPIFIH